MLAVKVIKSYMEAADEARIRKGERARLVGVSRASFYSWEKAVEAGKSICVRSDTLERIAVATKQLQTSSK